MSKFIWYHLVFDFPSNFHNGRVIHSALSEVSAPSPLPGFNFFLPFYQYVSADIPLPPQTLIYSRQYRKIFMAHRYQPKDLDLYFRPVTLTQPRYDVLLCWTATTYMVQRNVVDPRWFNADPFHVAVGERHVL